MSAFTLDTSGIVLGVFEPFSAPCTWSDLSPFEQGYVEAVFAAWVASFPTPQERGVQRVQLRRVGFSDLAAETLAAIRKDCAEYARQQRADPKGWPALSGPAGLMFWVDRQKGFLDGDEPRFPPLTVALNDAGKVVFS